MDKLVVALRRILARLSPVVRTSEEVPSCARCGHVAKTRVSRCPVCGLLCEDRDVAGFERGPLSKRLR